MKVLNTDLNREFDKFYNSLQNKTDIFYMFFTTNMLFWAVKAYSLTQKDLNLVLLVAGLDEDELDFINKYFDCPIHIIDTYCDDRDIWELLFAVNRYNFGWIDCDCFIFDPNLYKEIIKIDDHHSMNCVWSFFDEFSNKYYSKSYFLFININTINYMKDMDLNVSPRVYVYEFSPPVRFTKCLYIENQHKEYIEKVMPLNYYPADSLHGQTSEFAFFDTLVLFQIIADSLGYPIHRIRDLDYTTKFCSDEAIHIGGSANFSNPHGFDKMKLLPNFKFDLVLFNIISYFIFKQSVHMLPDKYYIIYKKIKKFLTQQGYNEQNMKYKLSSILKNENLNERTLEMLFNL